MKTDFSINVKVNLGVTPELAQLVSAIFSHIPTNVQSDEALTATPAQVEEEPEDTDKPNNGKTEDNGKRSEANKNTGGDANAESQVSAEEQPKELTEEDVRAAIHKTRQRIEGEDYKEHTDGDLYKKYHRTLTSKFKEIAVFLGADKPSTLPAEKRANFIAQCDELQVLADGTIGTDLPF